MKNSNPFRYFTMSPEVICLAVMIYDRFPLSLRNADDLLHERGIDISYVSIRFWRNCFGSFSVVEVRSRWISWQRLLFKMEVASRRGFEIAKRDGIFHS